MDRKELLKALDGLLEPKKFKDYCPNGLQIQGKRDVRSVVLGVSASEELIDRALELKADTLIVHHGYFWRNESPCLTGIKRTRIKKILENNLNLIAYHLPLDANEKVGNNYELGRGLGVEDICPLEEEPLVLTGYFKESVSVEALSNKIEKLLGRRPSVVPLDSPAFISRVAFCTGAAQDYLETAAEAGAQAYLSGEISERTVLEAKELKVPYFSIGHHASETLGVKALAAWLAERFPQLKVRFVDIDNPV